ncbi:MAG TPA: futalosine hydrolase [Desulfobacteraceae bacterium]|nr:futalosine hydrolase [Desulfobacteraceae bacterium]
MDDRNILILAATEMEATPLLEIAVTGRETTSRAGRRIVEGKHGSQDFRLIITGPGSINCTQALAAELENNHPRLVLQTGIAGVFRETGLRIGDIAVADCETCIHTGVEDPWSPLKNAPLPFDLVSGTPSTRQGVFPINRTLSRHALDLLSRRFLRKKCRVMKGPFITVSTVTATRERARALFSSFSPCMEAMEGSAAAHVAALYNTDFLEIRCGSNYAGIRDKEKWNIPLATQRACRAAAFLLDTSLPGSNNKPDTP